MRGYSMLAGFVPVVLATALLPVILPAAEPAQSPRATSGTAEDVLPFDATQRTLPNGLKVIVIPTGFPNLVSLQIPVQTGSRNEVEPGKSGFAHFFEHLMFRGTPDTPPEKYPQHNTPAAAREHDTTRAAYAAIYAPPA
jgi:zinc protease